jgi:signal transduction histidine kinase
MRRAFVEEALADRRAVERELHDGVQQDLIALSIRVQLACRLAEDDPGALPALLDEMRADLRDALERLRRLADRVYPSLLAPFGLLEALRGVGIEVDAHDLGRLDATAEATAYLLCRDLEATGPVDLRLDAGTLVVCFPAVPDPGRLAAAQDRVELLGGSFGVEPRGEGVYVSAAIPAARSSAR